MWNLNRVCSCWCVRIVLLPLFCATLLSCVHTPDWSRDITWSEFSLANLPDSVSHPNAGAIVLLDEGEMDLHGFRDGGTSTLARHRIVRILNSGGHRYANIVIPYGGSSVVDGIEARTISPSGRITMLSPEQIYDANLYPNFIFFSDQRARLFTMPAIEDGSIVEYRYRITVKGISYWHSWMFQDDVPVLVSRFALSVPSDLQVRHRSYGVMVPPSATKSPNGRRTTFRWELRNILPLPHEFAMPPATEKAVHLAIGPIGFNTWNDVTRWYGEIFRNRMGSGGEIATLADSLTRPESGTREKLRRLFEWVRDHIRYIAVEIGIGGYQPHRAEEVLENRYGDCKDMVVLLSSLAAAAGVEVIPVLVSTWQNGTPDSTFATPLQFNHLIGYAPSEGREGIWMDATEKDVPFSALPWYDQGLPVLVADSTTRGGIRVTPRSTPTDNRMEMEWDVQLSPSGSAIVSGMTRYSGDVASEVRSALRYGPADERRLWVERALAARCSGVVMDTFNVAFGAPGLGPVEIRYRFKTAQFGTLNEGALTLRPGMIGGIELPDYFRSSTRVHPVRFRFGMSTSMTMNITAPAGFNPSSAIKDDSLRYQFGGARWHLSSAGQNIHFSASYDLAGKEIPPSEYIYFREFLDRIRTKDLQELTLRPAK